MPLAGNLRTMPLPDLLQWIVLSRKAGTLLVERVSIKKKILFRDGEIISSWSNDPRESLGQFLIRERRVTEEQLFKALLRQESEGRPLGSILVGDGVLSEADLKHALTVKAQETVFDLFLWPDGSFQFLQEELSPDIPFTIAMGVSAVVFEGARRVDEWARIRAAIPTVRATFVAMPMDASVLDPVEREALALAATGKTLGEIALNLRRSDFEAASVMFGLLERDLVLLADPGEETRPLDTVEAIQLRLALAQQRLEQKRYDLALKAFEEVLSLDRLNQQAKKGILAATEARERERSLKRVPLESVPRLLMDLVSLTKQKLDPQEGFVISRINGEWDVRSILSVCPIPEPDALMIFVRLLDRKIIALR
jgi:hypothetical protein